MDGIEKAYSGASAALDKVASDANMADLDPQQLEEIHKKCKTLKDNMKKSRAALKSLENNVKTTEKEMDNLYMTTEMLAKKVEEKKVALLRQKSHGAENKTEEQLVQEVLEELAEALQHLKSHDGTENK